MSSTDYKGVSLHIGVNRLDQTRYFDANGQGFEGYLSTCENDARYMADVARANGVRKPLVLPTAEATRERVFDALETARDSLRDFGPHGLLIFTFSGHGGLVPDYNGDETSERPFDSTICCHDYQIVDDEIWNAFSTFTNNRIVFVSDSCHSGTVIKITPFRRMMTSLNPYIRDEQRRDNVESRIGNLGTGPGVDELSNGDTGGAKPKCLPESVAEATIKNQANFYGPILDDIPSPDTFTMSASALLLGACADNELAYTGATLSRYTFAIYRALGEDRLYSDSHEHLQSSLGSVERQTPKYMSVGAKNPDFDAQSAFRVELG